MPPCLERSPLFLVLAFVAIAFIGAVRPADAGTISPDVWYEFSFEGSGSTAGCDPADPAGAFCISSSGTLTTEADAPPWTFVTAGAATFTVTDAFLNTDAFEIFDFGVSLGTTSPAGDGSAACGDDPVPCLADPDMSHGVFALGAGAHSITIASLEDEPGVGYFILEAAAVNEPASMALFAIGLLAAGLVVGRRWPARMRT